MKRIFIKFKESGAKWEPIFDATARILLYGFFEPEEIEKIIHSLHHENDISVETLTANFKGADDIKI